MKDGSKKKKTKENFTLTILNRLIASESTY